MINNNNDETYLFIIRWLYTNKTYNSFLILYIYVQHEIKMYYSELYPKLCFLNVFQIFLNI
jgi:hypothetical protein